MFDNLRENFEIILIVAFFISAVTYVIYRLTFYRTIRADYAAHGASLKNLSRKERKRLKHNILACHLDNAWKKTVFFFADLFWILLFVVVVRSFLYEPFIIPSGSMKPELQIGDIVLVNKYEKGLRMPITNKRLTSGEPIQRGDVVVFKYPNNPKMSYIKRVIGLPGDTVYYDNRTMTINGKAVELKKLHPLTDSIEIETRSGTVERKAQFTVFEEDLLGLKHTIRYANGFQANYIAREWKVPEGKYLMMGDNRDSSADGRAFGYLDDNLIIGRAKRIAFNFDCLKFKGKCNRFFKEIK